MPTHNSDIADIFDKFADLLEIKGESVFRIRAYRNAARIINGLPKSASLMIADGDDLTELPGIGKDLASKIKEIAETGKLAALVSYLLQRMESYRGIAILTTNMQNALDTAFQRRLRFVVQFPFPDPPSRERIWRKVFPGAAPTGTWITRSSRNSTSPAARSAISRCSAHFLPLMKGRDQYAPYAGGLAYRIRQARQAVVAG